MASSNSKLVPKKVSPLSKSKNSEGVIIKPKFRDKSSIKVKKDDESPNSSMLHSKLAAYRTQGRYGKKINR